MPSPPDMGKAGSSLQSAKLEASEACYPLSPVSLYCSTCQSKYPFFQGCICFIQDWGGRGRHWKNTKIYMEFYANILKLPGDLMLLETSTSDLIKEAYNVG